MFTIRLIAESLGFAWKALRSNLLRTVLSLLGVTIGIFSIIAVLTLVDSLKKNIVDSLNFLGTDVIYIHKWPWGAGDRGRDWWKEYIKRPQASYSEYRFLKANMQMGQVVSIYAESESNTVKAGSNGINKIEVDGASRLQSSPPPAHRPCGADPKAAAVRADPNGRQTLFYKEPRNGLEAGELRYRAVMIDQGFCFNAGEWSFPDAPLRGLYARNRVYEGVTGRESFGPWIERLEKRITEKVFDDLIREIPPEWYEDDLGAVMRLAEHLYRRRTLVPELLLAARNTTRHPFPNWM